MLKQKYLHNFVATKKYFVATSILLSQQNFLATIMILVEAPASDNILGAGKGSYLCEDNEVQIKYKI